MKSEKQIKQNFKATMHKHIKEIKRETNPNNSFNISSSIELLFFAYYDMEIITRSTRKRYEKLILGYTL